MKALFALTAAAIVAASTASAAGYIFQDNKFFDHTKPLSIDIVNTSAPATLEIYSAKANEAVALVGSQELTAGAHTDIRFTGLKTDVIAVLKVNGEIVDQQLIERE